MKGRERGSKNQRATNRRAARELATAAKMPVTSNPHAGGAGRERGGRALARTSGGITNSSHADHVRARIRETITVQNLPSQVNHLCKEVSGGEVPAGDGRHPQGC
jgi:hypothetical protein